MHEELSSTALKTDKAFIVLLEDFDYVKQTWTFAEYDKYFQKFPSFEELSLKLQTIWLIIGGQEVQCSWDYNVRGEPYQPATFHQPYWISIHCAQGSCYPFIYKTKTPRVYPPDTRKISETILIERA
jgi:hypothetical protein